MFTTIDGLCALCIFDRLEPDDAAGFIGGTHRLDRWLAAACIKAVKCRESGSSNLTRRLDLRRSTSSCRVS